MPNWNRLPLLTGLVLATSGPALAQNCPDTNDLLLANGRIHTMQNQPGTDPVIFESIRIIGDRVAYLGAPGAAQVVDRDCTEIIDLEGRTVIPGIIDGWTEVHESMPARRCHASLHCRYTPKRTAGSSARKTFLARSSLASMRISLCSAQITLTRTRSRMEPSGICIQC